MWGAQSNLPIRHPCWLCSVRPCPNAAQIPFLRPWGHTFCSWAERWHAKVEWRAACTACTSTGTGSIVLSVIPLLFSQNHRITAAGRAVRSSNPTINNLAALIHLILSPCAFSSSHSRIGFPNTNAHRKSCTFYLPAQGSEDSASL